MAFAQDTDGKLEEPTDVVLGATVTIPSTAVDAATAVPVFDFQIVNPTGTSTRSIKIDQIIVTFSGGATAGGSPAALADLGGAKVIVSGSGGPTFTNTDSTLITGGGDPVTLPAGTAASRTLIMGSAADGEDDADLLAVANDDTVVVTVYAWLVPGTVIDDETIHVSVGAVTRIATDTGGNTDLMAVGSFNPHATVITEQTALIIQSTAALTPAGLDTTVTVPSTATSKLVAVPVFEFKLTDDDDGATSRPTQIDGLTIPITLAGGMDPTDIAGAALVITSSEPLNTTVFSATVGGDREINTADDPNYIKLVQVGDGLELRVGLDAGSVGTGNDGMVDLLNIADPNLTTDETVTLTVKIWLNNSGITGNSIASFDLQAANITMDTGGAGTDVINVNEDLPNGVATVIAATSENTTLSDRSVVPNALTLPSSAITQATAFSVFDFFVTDGIGGQSTKIDSLTIPVTLSGGAKFSDLAGAKLTVNNGAGITLAHVGGSSIDLTNNPTLVHIDSVSVSTARITFKGQASIDTADATANLIEIPDGGTPVAFTLAVWVDTTDIAYGATFTFDLQNQHVTLTGQQSDGLAASQNVSDGVVSVGVTRLVDHSAVSNAVTVSTGHNAATATVSVFDFKIIDPADGKPTLIDAIYIPIATGGGASLANIAGATLTVSGLSSNVLAGAAATISTADGDGAAGGGVDHFELSSGNSRLEAGVNAGGFGDVADNAGSADLLSVPDGETAILTVALWINQSGVTDGATLTFDLQDVYVDVDNQAGATDVFAASQNVTDGVSTLRAATLVNNSTVSDSVYVSTSQQTAPGVSVFDFQIVDPADGKPTVIDGLFIPWVFNGGAVIDDIGEVTLTVTVGGAAASIPDDATAGADDDGTIVSGTDGTVIALVAGGIEVGSDGTVGGGAATANSDGAAGFFTLADGQTAVVTAKVYFTTGAPPANGETVGFDLQTANLAVDGTAGLSGGIAASQDVTNGLLLVTGATSELSDYATVANAVNLASTTTTSAGAVAVFDFKIQDLDAVAGGSNNPTRVDGITIPISLSGMQFADIGGAKVTSSGASFTAGGGASDTDSNGSLVTGSGDLGIELVDLTGGSVELHLGGAASGITANTSSGTAELIAVNDATDNGTAENPVIITVALWLKTSGIDDNATLTLGLQTAKFQQDTNTADLIVEKQRVTSGVATIKVTATKLVFTAPASNTLATRGISDTVKVAATDVNSNVDVDYAANIAVTTNSGTGQFSQNGSTFLNPGVNLSATPANGRISFFYKDSATGSPTLTASSGSLTSGIFVFTVQAFTATVTWTSPVRSDTTATDSAGTYHRLQYTVASNDPNLKVEFWVAQSATLPTITSQNANPLTVFNPDSSKVLGKLRNPTGAAYGPGANKMAATDVPISVTSQYVYTSGLSAGTWYIYMVRADNDGVSAGGDTLGRSGALKVLHYPEIVAFGVTEAQDGTVDSGTSFARDSGGTSPSTSINLLLYAEDHNSNDNVKLYISTKSNLTASTVATDTSGTYRIAGTTDWKTDDVGDTLRYATVTISDSLGSSAYHPKGTYYFYALVTDADDSTKVSFAKAQNLSSQQQSLGVNHAPILTFSQPAAAVTGYSIAAQPRMTLAWNGSGAAGDQDIDDNAYISLWFAVADSTPDAFADTSQSWLKKIVSGLREDPDGGANDQYAWDLTQFDGQLPAAGTPIKVWALLRDTGTTPVFASTPQITFAAYNPSLVLLNPPPGAATELRENETYRFFFDANYVSDATTNATVRFFISSKDTTSLDAAPAVFTFDTGASSTFPGNYNAFWVSGDNQLKEGTDSYFDWTPKSDGNNYAAEIVPQTSTTTTFYLYAVINDNGNAITSPNGLKLARAPGRVKINGLGTTLSDPATVASPNQAQVTAGDTIRVLLKGNTNNTAVQGAQLYVNIDSTKFALVDQDAVTAGVQPFGFESGYFFGSVSAQINRVNLSSGIYKLDLDKRNLSAPEDPTGKTIAHVDLVARSFSGSAEVNWSLDRVNDPNRYPLFFNASGELAVLFFNPLATFNTVSRGSISGFVPLQGNGRTTDAKVTTFWLRRPGSWISISDTAFVNTNDDSSSVEGIQKTTGSNGSFTLTQVPAGVYELVAKSESYLAGYASVSVVNGQTLTGVTPTRIATDNDPGQLLGGDITGDNKIDTNDESALNLAYESSSGESNFNSAADVDDDGSVLLSDLLILAANLQTQLLTGVAPVYKPAVAEGTTLTLADVPLEVRGGEEFEVQLVLEGVQSLAGYSLGLEFDPGILTVVEAKAPLLASHPTVKIQRESRAGRYVLAEAVKGARDTQIDQPLLATVRFRALTDASNPGLTVAGASLADGSGQQVELPARVTRALPERFALRQNVPNPFNPSTHLSFDVPRDGVPVALTIFNVMGQPVRKLVQAREMRAGRYSLSWDGRDDQGRSVGSGTYLYTLRAGDFVQTRKMTMMK